MASIEISSKEKWERAQKALNRVLEKEVALMRELLANLHQEELSLLEVDRMRWSKVMDERSDMVMQLRKIRNRRAVATRKLEKLATKLEKAEILPADDESSCEILTKLDQEIALIDRINLQNCRNDALFDQAKQKTELPLHCAYPHPLHQPKRKTSVATTTKNQP